MSAGLLPSSPGPAAAARAAQVRPLGHHPAAQPNGSGLRERVWNPPDFQDLVVSTSPAPGRLTVLLSQLKTTSSTKNRKRQGHLSGIHIRPPPRAMALPTTQEPEKHRGVFNLSRTPQFADIVTNSGHHLVSHKCSGSLRFKPARPGSSSPPNPQRRSDLKTLVSNWTSRRPRLSSHDPIELPY